MSDVCKGCGYTEADALVHGDHYLCAEDGRAPWQRGKAGNSQRPVPYAPLPSELLARTKLYLLGESRNKKISLRKQRECRLLAEETEALRLKVEKLERAA